MRQSKWCTAVLAISLAALIMAAGASAATVRIGVTGSVTLTDPGNPQATAAFTGVAGDFTTPGNPTGTVTVTTDGPPFDDMTGPGASLTEFHGAVSQGCVRTQDDRALVVGHLPANEQFDIPFGHMEYVGVLVDDNGVASGSPVDQARVIFFRTSPQPFTACNPSNTGIWSTALLPLDAGDAGLGYTDQLDGFPANPDTDVAVIDPNGLSVAISDAPDPDGVQVAVGAGSGSATINSCGLDANVDAGSTVIATCGSLILEVVTGAAEVVLEDGVAVVSIPAGGVAEITEEPDGSYTVENQGTTPIEVTVDGETETIEPGETSTVEAWDFQGFTGLASPPALNKANAGSSVPLKWRVVDAAGVPVTDLSTATITVSNVDCATGADLGNAQPAQTAGSLQNRGGGNYQLNWKTQKSWAGTCKAMHLDIGDGVTHDAYFRFK